MQRWCLRSPCGRYRWILGRRWADGPVVAMVGLNPSTADGTCDDPTLRRAMGFAERAGFGALWVVNLYAYRTPKPAALWRADDPMGPGNATWRGRAIDRADAWWAAWGNAGHGAEADALLARGDALVLGWTGQGAPKHPLYVPAVTSLRPGGQPGEKA